MGESVFISKIEAVCQKKQSLYENSKTKYAIRSIFAGAFLTLSTAAGAIAADAINQINPHLGRFVFPFIFAWGLVYIVFLNAELTTSNMMYLSAGTFLKKIDWKKALIILLYCTLFNLIGALLMGWLFAHTSAFEGLSKDSFIVHVVEHKLERDSGLVLLEAILANVFVNVAILSFVLVKDSTARILMIISAIYMFVFLSNEHIAANFASFSLVNFSQVRDQVAHFEFGNILRHGSMAFMGNLIGGGFLIGLPYAFLNQNEKFYTD